MIMYLRQVSRMNKMNDIIDSLLIKAKDYPEIYNEASRWLYKSYNMVSAELSLLLACYIIDNKEDKNEKS